VIEVPKYKEIINKFIYETLENSPIQDLDQLTIEGTIEKLESFLQMQAPSSESSKTALISRPTFYCSHHGNNSTHVTERCRYLNSRQTRQFRRSSERGPSRSSFRSRSNDSRGRSWSRDRNYSRDRNHSREREGNSVKEDHRRILERSLLETEIEEMEVGVAATTAEVTMILRKTLCIQR
jgi:hypothetical protein